jgi:hypothetical protein
VAQELKLEGMEALLAFGGAHGQTLLDFGQLKELEVSWSTALASYTLRSVMDRED